MKTYVHTTVCLFLAALFKITGNWTQPKCLSAGYGEINPGILLIVIINEDIVDKATSRNSQKHCAKKNYNTLYSSVGGTRNGGRKQIPGGKE